MSDILHNWYCVFCRQKFQAVPENRERVLREHVKICPKHPMRELEQEIVLLDKLVAIVDMDADCEGVGMLIEELRTLRKERNQ